MSSKSCVLMELNLDVSLTISNLVIVLEMKTVDVLFC